MAFVLSQTGLIIIPALVIGLIVGILEIIFLYKDVPGKWVSHGFHAFIFAIFFVFVNMNVEYIINLFGWSLPFPVYYIYLGIALIAFIKVYGTVIIKKPAEVTESTKKVNVSGRILHTLIISLLIAASPYIWEFIESYIIK
jgi:hypothetical protein